MQAGQVDILGFSCRMPESSSPAQFWDNLAGGRDMVTEDSSRWPAGIAGMPRRFGKIPGLAAFDAAFFKVHGRLAQVRAVESWPLLWLHVPKRTPPMTKVSRAPADVPCLSA